MNKECKKITIIGANPDTGNMGVSALLMGAVTCIKQAWPHADISLLDYDDHHKCITCYNKGDNVSVSLIPLRFSKKFYLPNNIAFLLFVTLLISVFPFSLLQQVIIQKNRYLKHLYESDIIMSIAGGDSFSDIYGLERYVYIVLLQILTIMAGKKLIVLPQTIGPFKSVFASCIAAFILKHSHEVYCRDQQSLIVAQELIGNHTPQKARFCYDMGFVLEPVEPDIHIVSKIRSKLHRRVLAGLNISGLLCMGGYTCKNMFGLNVDYTELIRLLIPWLISTKKCTVVLVPHVFGGAPESDVSATTRFFHEFREQYGNNIHLISGSYNQNQIKYCIGKCDFFIGSRMHACIAALSQCVPAVGIAYSRKFAGVLTTIGMQAFIADPRTMSYDDIIKLIEHALDTRNELQKLLKKQMPHITDTVLNFLKRS